MSRDEAHTLLDGLLETARRGEETEAGVLLREFGHAWLERAFERRRARGIAEEPMTEAELERYVAAFDRGKERALEWLRGQGR
jgi:hypothetical protein